jgi:hypothetical protein
MTTSNGNGKREVSVTFKVQCDGFGADVTADCLIEHIPGIVARLREHGIAPANSPYVWQGQPQDRASANGNGHAANAQDAPVCPRHNQPLLHSKFGNGWYCGSKTDNPEWANPKDYCNHTV